MKRCPSHILTLILALSATPAWAASIYQCEDSKGNRSFEAHCPPGTKPVDQKTYNTEGGGEAESPRAAVTIYLVPNCDTCDQVKEFLSIRNIRPIEKDVAGNVRLQEELKAKAGDLRVPVTVIGNAVINGYNRSEMLEALAAAGYGEDGGDSTAATGAEGEGTDEEEVFDESFDASGDETAAEPAFEDEPAAEEFPEE